VRRISLKTAEPSVLVPRDLLPEPVGRPTFVDGLDRRVKQIIASSCQETESVLSPVVTGEEVMDQTIPTGVAPPFIEVNSFGLLSHCFAPLALRPRLAFVVAA
jgi:hypothetical protein